MTPAPGDPVLAGAWLRRLATAIGAGADTGLHGSRLRVRLELPRRPKHRSAEA